MTIQFLIKQLYILCFLIGHGFDVTLSPIKMQRRKTVIKKKEKKEQLKNRTKYIIRFSYIFDLYLKL